LKTSGETSGLIFNIQHFCVHDGPGIRTTIFFMGCPLDCLWCHNPEGVAKGRLISFAEGKCAMCGECARVCPEAHRFNGGKHEIRREKLPDSLYGESAAACVTKALTVVGDRVTAGEAFERVLRDRRFYEDGGGVTFSGGEPTMQRDFLAALLRLAAGEGIHAALETCGLCDFAYFEQILPLVGLFLYDYKETDPERHRKYTGAGNALILENIGRLHAAGAQIILRCPIIPGVNDRDGHFAGIAALTERYPGLIGAEILPYHRLAASKAGRMGLRKREEYAQPTAEDAAAWRDRVRAFGGRVVEP
jgi:pyruvate formate lyase activating enzyme